MKIRNSDPVIVFLLLIILSQVTDGWASIIWLTAAILWFIAAEINEHNQRRGDKQSKIERR